MKTRNPTLYVLLIFGQTLSFCDNHSACTCRTQPRQLYCPRETSHEVLLCRLFSHGFLGALCVFYGGGHLLCTLHRVHGSFYSPDNLCWIPSCNVKGWNVLSGRSIHWVTKHPTDGSFLCRLAFVTTLPAPTIEPLPTVTPGQIITLPPSQQSSSIQTSLPSSGPAVPFLKAGSSGCVPAKMLQLGPTSVRAPM
jgi:hypothetical protein